MVSSGQVSGDRSSFLSALSDYDSKIGELEGIWKGDSYNNLTSKAKSFSSDFSSAISNQMNEFASACDLYENYISEKRNLEHAQSQYQNAVNSKDNDMKSFWSGKISTGQSNMNSLRGQIQSKLASVTSVKVDATSI